MPTPGACAGCHNDQQVLKQDKRFNDWLCIPCFSSRRNEALRAGDHDFFILNDLMDSLSSDEKYKLGI